LDLFAAPAAANAGASSATALDSAVDLIRERFGNFAVRRGSALPVARGAEEPAEDMSEEAPGRRRGRAEPPPQRR
jgi:hypothetical protein